MEYVVCNQVNIGMVTISLLALLQVDCKLFKLHATERDKLCNPLHLTLTPAGHLPTDVDIQAGI